MYDYCTRAMWEEKRLRARHGGCAAKYDAIHSSGILGWETVKRRAAAVRSCSPRFSILRFTLSCAPSSSRATHGDARLTLFWNARVPSRLEPDCTTLRELDLNHITIIGTVLGQARHW